MKSVKIKLSLCLCILFVAQTPIECGQVLRRPETPNRRDLDSLRLPSFSIFGLPLSGYPFEDEALVEQNSLQRFVRRFNTERTNGTLKEGDYLWIVPMALYKSRGLFEKNSWSSEEIKQGQMIADFFAKLAGEPKLIIAETNEDAFGKGLGRLRDWFETLCRDNKTLASMIYTLDSGPFFGEAVPIDRFPAMRLIGSVEIPKTRARFVLLADETQKEPMVIGIINSDSSVRWLRRLSATPQAFVTNAMLPSGSIVIHEGYGFVVQLVADWSSSRQRCSIYLDGSLELRFYYLAW